MIGTLNAMCKSIQLMDREHEQGFRGVYLSKYEETLEGFSPNRQRVFGQIVSVMPDFSVRVNLAFIPERTGHPIVNRKTEEGF